jgi:signal transduction histidine kinase
VCNALLDNALKFTTSQGRVMFSFEVDGDHLVIRLSDDGRPIAPEYDDAIFERGVQWEARQHGSRTSVGLGLPFARAAMRRMNGDLVAYSSPADKITVFSLYLPLADQANNR